MGTKDEETGINSEKEQFIASQRIKNMSLNDGCMSDSYVYFLSPT